MNEFWKRFFRKGVYKPMLHGRPIISFKKGGFGPMLHSSPAIPLDIPLIKTPNDDKKEKNNKIETEGTEVQTKSAIEAERKRLAEIDEIASLYDSETIFEAKYGENACTAQEMTFRAAQKAAKQGKNVIKDMEDDFKASGAEDVDAVPAAEDDDKPLTPEQRIVVGRANTKKIKNMEEK